MNHLQSNPVRFDMICAWFLLVFFGAAVPNSSVCDSSFPPAAPESQGISSSALDELISEIQEWTSNEYIVGAEILLIKNRRTILHESVGWKDREKNKPWGLNTICNIRSMSKPITGAAAQILIDRGRLSLDDSAAQSIPGFDNDKSRNITLRLLLTHRSGLPLSLLTTGYISDTLFELANITGERGPQFPPDSKFWYSDAGSEVVGAIVERIAGESLDRFITTQILVPMEMHDAFSYTPIGENDSIWERMASLYYGRSGSWTKIWSPDQKKTLYPWALGSQSIYCTPLDYAKFLAMWMDEGVALNGKRILSSKAIERTLTPVSQMTQLGSDAPMIHGFDQIQIYYGQFSMVYAPSEGETIGKPVVIGHSGSDGTWAWAWPDKDFIALFFTQSRGQMMGIRMETLLDRLIIQGGKTREIPDAFQPYVGSYIGLSSEVKDIVYKIDVLQEKLALDIPGYPLFPLKSPNSRGFWFSEHFPAIYVSFRKDAEGNVTEMHYSEGGYTFRFAKSSPTPVQDWKIHESDGRANF